MGVESLRGFLSRHRRIALDTSIFIYQLESNPRYVFYTDHIFSWLERPGSQAVTSSITMTELLVQPFRDADKRRVAEVYGLLSTLPSLEWIAPSLEIAALAARMRALHRMRTPDALQAATAVNALATGLITNDSVFERVEDIEALVIEKLLA
ncbi:MAG TPA: type II toxin-antitoxin system VapC family toxin [Candidatus Acidoferrales bacterium]|nr:type II toxin-antitoxin system VapC family toxin [Candidatus Acidoferrales bacterium]